MNNSNLDELINLSKPSKEKIFKIVSKDLINNFKNFKNKLTQDFDFSFEFINKINHNENKKQIKEDVKIFIQENNLSPNNNLINLFISDFNKLNLNGEINKNFVLKFINEYTLYFADIILSFEFFVLIKILINNNNQLNIQTNDNSISYRNSFIKSYKSFKTKKEKFELLFRSINKYNKEIIYELFQKDFLTKYNEEEEIDLKKKIKKNISLNEKVIENSNLIGELSKEEKEKREKEIEQKEIKEMFPTYENEIDIYHKNSLILKKENNEENNNIINPIQMFLLLNKLNQYTENSDIYIMKDIEDELPFISLISSNENNKDNLIWYSNQILNNENLNNNNNEDYIYSTLYNSFFFYKFASQFNF